MPSAYSRDLFGYGRVAQAPSRGHEYMAKKVPYFCTRACGRLVWLSIMLVLALWGTTGAVEEVHLVYIGSTATTTWRGIEQGLREANILGGFTGYTYTVEPVSPEALLGVQRDKLPLAVVAATGAETLQRLSARVGAAR